MLFNSIEFALFLPIVFAIYWFVVNKKLRLQNFLLLSASYFFYGWWDWRFLFLIFFSTCVDYLIGLKLFSSSSERNRKLLLWVSLGFNLGLLGVFKYFNFFAESFADAFQFFGVSFEPARLNVILPIGISFYTFQTLSYSIDIYKERIEPTRNFVAFAAFVSFFPQLVAGPIERASNLMPQFLAKRNFDLLKAKDGLRQILWGLFKKIVIADNCAVLVETIYSNPDSSGSNLAIAAILFTFQVYGDFSGYSDIAIGTARLFGFNLMQNFAFPYFSPNMTEFYRRWHISLSTWIRDYVFTPVGLSLRHLNKNYGYIVVFLITFTVFGFWHGANWTYIVFGVFQGIAMSYEYKTRKRRKKIKAKVNANLYFVMSCLLTYAFWCFSCIIFRAESIDHAISIFSGIASSSLFSMPDYVGLMLTLTTFKFILAFMIVEWFGRNKQYAIENIGVKWKRPIRWIFYVAIISMIFIYGGEKQEFIYFQF